MRALTPEGRIRRFPTDLDHYGPVGHVEIPQGSEEQRALIQRETDTLNQRSESIDLDLLRECTLAEPRPYPISELADLLFDSGGTPEERGALLFALNTERSPFVPDSEGYVPLHDTALEDRRREAEERKRREIKKAERARLLRERKSQEKKTLLPELRLLLAGKILPDALSEVTRGWLMELREEIVSESAVPRASYGGDLITLRDENHAVQILARAGLWDPYREDLIAVRNGIGLPIPDAIAVECASLEPKDMPSEDLTDLPTFTIDSAETMDLDDAISIKEEGDAWRVWIHVADVDRWVSKDGSLDRWAQDRSESVYLPEVVHHLFPKELVSHLSLDPSETRHAFSFSFVLSSTGEVTEQRFARSTVRSDYRLDYEEADRRLKNDPDWTRRQSLIETLQKRREARGAKVTLLPDLVIEPGRDDIRTRIVISDTMSHRLISELMVFFNEQLALFFRGRGIPAVFKTQPEATDTSAFPDPDDSLYFPRIIRLLKPSVAGLDPGPHSFLGVEAYCQGTSPIRRYQDLIHQRQLAAALNGEPLPYTLDDLSVLVPQLDSRAGEVRMVERRRRRFWLLCKLDTLRGERLMGIVSQIRPGGRPVVFFPEYLLETPLLLPIDLHFEIGDELFVTPRRVDPIRGGVWASPAG